MSFLLYLSDNGGKMKLSSDFIRHEMDGRAILVPLQSSKFRGVVQGNKSVGVILECLENETDEESIVRIMCERFDGDENEIRKDVRDVISSLEEIGAIEGT